MKQGIGYTRKYIFRNIGTLTATNFRWIMLVTAALFFMLFACSKKNDMDANAAADGKIRVVCTIGMISDVAKRVGGEDTDVKGLMGSGVDPHLYKARESDVGLMSGADIIFYNGLHLEGAMSEVLKKMQGAIRTVAVAESIDSALLLTLSEFEGAYDPHVWFDVTLWMKVVERIRDVFIELDVEHQESYMQNTRMYLSQLEELHQYVKEQAERVPKARRVLVTAHDAFNYFGKAYGFEVRGLQGISTAAEAGTGDVQKLAEYIATNKIPAIFVESSVPRRNIEAVQAAVKARGHEVKIGGELFSDAPGDAGKPEGTYAGMVRHNIDTIVGALLGMESSH